MLETAKRLFEKGWSKGIDETYGGLFFALSPEEDVIDEDKNYWVIAEAISAASLLGAKTGISAYWANYDRLFAYASSHFIDHHYGGWYTLLDRSNKAYSNQKTAAPKADYHPIAACYQTILALKHRK
jgi:mannose/cellobiose epimerase-like protein (N-acyl-D-glucosamine 2-epimerase family)